MVVMSNDLSLGKDEEIAIADTCWLDINTIVTVSAGSAQDDVGDLAESLRQVHHPDILTIPSL